MAAVMSSSTAFYDIGEMLIKNKNSNASGVMQTRPNPSPIGFQPQCGTFQSPSTQQQQQQQQQQDKLFRLNSNLLQQFSQQTTTTPQQQPGQHAPISRRVSTPARTAAGNISLNTASLVATTLLPVLENMQQQQQQQQSLHRKLDRSQSEPAKIIQVPQNINSSRYKTELCRPFEESGSCKYGDKCQFAHGAHELRNLTRHPKYKTELCRTFHTAGFCPYGPRCHFVHNAEEARMSTAQLQAMQRRPTPLTLVPPFPGSVSGSPSPSSSLSQSPTTSYCSFFSECDNSSSACDNISNPSPPPNGLFGSPSTFAPQQQQQAMMTTTSGSNSPSQSPEPNGSGSVAESRLPVFNLMGLGMSLEELLA